MSIRTLIEINHDVVSEDTGLSVALARYARTGSLEDADRLRQYGLRVLGSRHHSHNYIFSEDPDGFPIRYLEKPVRPARGGD